MWTWKASAWDHLLCCRTNAEMHSNVFKSSWKVRETARRIKNKREEVKYSKLKLKLKLKHGVRGLTWFPSPSHFLLRSVTYLMFLTRRKLPDNSRVLCGSTCSSAPLLHPAPPHLRTLWHLCRSSGRRTGTLRPSSWLSGATTSDGLFTVLLLTEGCHVFQELQAGFLSGDEPFCHDVHVTDKYICRYIYF